MNSGLSKIGLTDVLDLDLSSGFEHDSDPDSDLEAELVALSGGGNKAELKQNSVAAYELDEFIVESLKIVEHVGEEEDSAEADSELLDELQNMIRTGLNKDDKCVEESKLIQQQNTSVIHLKTSDISSTDIIKQRIKMYEIAEKNAKGAGEITKVRRFNRGLKTLNELLRQSISGKQINPDDIPPTVSVKPAVCEDSNTMSSNVCGKVPCEPVPVHLRTGEGIVNPLAVTSQNSQVIQQMLSLQQEYKRAAIKSKRNGDTAMALQYIKVVKRFDVVIKMCEDGQDVDLSDMPPPPELFKEFLESMQLSCEENYSDAQINPELPLATETESEVKPMNTIETDILEALQQRLSKYIMVEQAAKNEGNASKSRRFGRIVKQYEIAIKDYIDGRSVAYEDLPVPPGFGQLPTKNVTARKPSSDDQQTASGATPTPNLPTEKLSAAPQHDFKNRTTANQQKNTLAEKQLQILLERQKEFKIAAIGAKKAGDVEQAKEYLKIYKGFETLLNAARGGLSVDLSSLPLPPSQRQNLEDSFSIITTEDCDPNTDFSDIGDRVEEQLSKQLMMCKNTRDHHKTLGDIAGMNRFENLALTVQKDLDIVRYSKRKNFPLPKFHYEQRCFNIVHSNTDLTENELEIAVVRGINYNVSNPKEIDTYVRIHFPLPNDDPYKAKTDLVKNTDSPNYNQQFRIDILRRNRQFQRIFKRQSVKFEVYSRGGFLRSDTLIGTVNVKLQPLEIKCDIHDTFELTEGRKKIGGKLEIKIRVRNPILAKQIEQINEKWLIIDT